MTERTLVTFLLDRTGSMQSIKDDTIGAFNAYLAELKKGAANIAFTFIQFDSMSMDKVCVAAPLSDVKELNNDTYEPRASTPLIDAAYKTIKAVEKQTTPDDKVVICIQTDGHENCSTEYTWEQLNALIKEKSGQGWQFKFMGAGIDAYDQGSKMGIASADTVSYNKLSPEMTASAFAATASNTTMFASGLRSNTAYAATQKMAAGDVFDKTLINQPKAQDKKPAKTKMVDDLTL